jgi:hypothetical protein
MSVATERAKKAAIALGSCRLVFLSFQTKAYQDSLIDAVRSPFCSDYLTTQAIASQLKKQ